MPRGEQGLLDTSVVIDFEAIDLEDLPRRSIVSEITMAELAAGPLVAQEPGERAVRQDRLQRAQDAFDALPFDRRAALAYGRVFATTVAAGRKARGAHANDLLIAATALGAGLPLYTRNAADFRALDGLLEVVDV